MQELEGENKNPFTLTIDKDIEELFKKSFGKIQHKLSDERKEQVLKEISPEKSDFLWKLEEFEWMIGSNPDFNKSFGKITHDLDLSWSTGGWGDTEVKEKSLLSLTQEMDALVEQMLQATN